jgi:hypothetical protein
LRELACQDLPTTSPSLGHYTWAHSSLYFSNWLGLLSIVFMSFQSSKNTNSNSNQIKKNWQFFQKTYNKL